MFFPQEKHNHLLSCHGAGDSGEAYRCDLCSKTFNSEEGAYLHSKSRHAQLSKPDDRGQTRRAPIVLSSTSFQCQFCTVVATSEFAFWVHSYARYQWSFRIYVGQGFFQHFCGLSGTWSCRKIEFCVKSSEFLKKIRLSLEFFFSF